MPDHLRVAMPHHLRVAIPDHPRDAMLVGRWSAVTFEAGVRVAPHFARVLALVLALTIAPVHAARAHPLHTAVAEFRVAADGTLYLKVRAFSDDFSAAVSKATRTAVLADYRVSDDAVLRYVSNALRVEVAGRRVALALTAQRRDGDVTWLELRAVGVRSLKGAVVRNVLLMELHADQVNIVKAQYDGRAFTTLFSRADSLKTLP